MRYDAVIFDVDGVLVDTRRSFTAAVVDAVAADTGSQRFTAKEAGQLKAIRGFNNDWHIAIAAAAWVRYQSQMPFAEFVGSIDEHGGGLPGLKSLVGENPAAEFEARLTRLAQEAYGGTTACRRLYGFEPVTIRQPGKWRAEVPLLSPEMARTVASRAGIITGRNAAEMALAFELLGWRLPDEQVAVSDDPAFDKPNPVNLMAILRRLGSRKAILAGDSRDDLELVNNARQKGVVVDFCFIGPPPAPWPWDGHMFPSVDKMLNQIEVTYDDSPTD